MKMLLIIVGVILAVLVLSVVAMVVIGSRLNPNHVASRSLKLQRPPAEVYATIRNFGHAATWRTDVKQVELLGNVDGHVRFREHGPNGAVNYEVMEDVPGQRLVTRILDQDLGYSGSWEYAIVPDASGSTLTITERGEVSNPLFRFMSRYVFGQTATIESYLKSLAAHFGEKI